MPRPDRLAAARRRAPLRRSSPAAPRRWTIGLALIVAGGCAGVLAALPLMPPPPVRAESGVAASGAAGNPTADRLTARFGLCHTGGGRNCVVDGDTFWFAGEKYRIADIDAPETHPARCTDEARLGRAATMRLQQWLNAGAFSLDILDRDTDRYGRKLRVVTRGGASAGDALVAEGLARPWEGRRRPWC